MLDLSNNQRFTVNSYHRNLISEQSLGNNLKPFALSQHDKTIEGFFHESLPIMGVMWH